MRKDLSFQQLGRLIQQIQSLQDKYTAYIYKRIARRSQKIVLAIATKAIHVLQAGGEIICFPNRPIENGLNCHSILETSSQTG